MKIISNFCGLFRMSELYFPAFSWDISSVFILFWHENAGAFQKEMIIQKRLQTIVLWWDYTVLILLKMVSLAIVCVWPSLLLKKRDLGCFILDKWWNCDAMVFRPKGSVPRFKVYFHSYQMDRKLNQLKLSVELLQG